METSFLTSTNQFLCIFQRLLPVTAFFPSTGNIFFSEFFSPTIGEGFSLYWKPSTLLESAFLLAETVTDMSGNQFLKKDLFLASGN